MRGQLSLNHIAIISIIIMAALIIGCSGVDNIREPKYAGSWYPGDNKSCSEKIDSLISEIELQQMSDIRAIVVPHAGWDYSGKVAAGAYAELGDVYDKVILIGPSHRSLFSGASLPNYTHFSSPSGKVKVSDFGNLTDNRLFAVTDAHDGEHSLEVQLPFLQRVLSDFEILPILIGPLTGDDELQGVADALIPHITDQTLIVVSSDFTHYGTDYQYTPFKAVADTLPDQDIYIADRLLVLDSKAVEFITNMDSDGFLQFCDDTGATICGKKPIAVLLNMVKSRVDEGFDYEITPLYYDTSGRMTGDYTNSVSYASIAFSEKASGETALSNLSSPLTEDEQNLLLGLARSALEQHLVAGTMPDVDERFLSDAMKRVQGCFTTLHEINQDAEDENARNMSVGDENTGEEDNESYEDKILRGCIGHITPQEELYKCVMDNAVNAGVNDARFEQVTYEEVKRLEFEISVLSVPEKLDYVSSDDLLNKLQPGIDGVVLKKGFKSATYLPQVWEQLPDKKVFLGSLCEKAGLEYECWRDDPEILTYQAFVFSE